MDIHNRNTKVHMFSSLRKSLKFSDSSYYRVLKKASRSVKKKEYIRFQ